MKINLCRVINLNKILSEKDVVNHDKNRSKSQSIIIHPRCEYAEG